MGVARLLPGGPVADRVLGEVAAEVVALRAAGVTPSLATVLVGDDDASAGYIRIKQRQAAELGFVSPHVRLPASASQVDLHRVIEDFNADRGVHGVLVQHPVPGGLDYGRALQVLDPDKDVDGMHPVNLGRLALGLPGPVPCTPAGIEALLAFHGVSVAGREVVVLGRGATLGRPLAMLLAQKRATANAAVTVVHTGVAGIVRPEHVRPGAVVVGGGVRYAGRRLLPDVDPSCARVAGAITPRVGGVGPTTVAMLFRNSVGAVRRAVGG
ncbi:bifunctional 5,10-methylenetetrahydrofolate dehydrogenase/5,10-methenyltetrahydrofolate cyclohydrolase [Micromonospora haikouensis]|uniref:bifunctional 5,10-methylenetetrahydrofolate dehydrogenase/5,10-methenyltetrahydrofolate cyclohydrolase n=1 Tax=Micromonospora haikouensis TaxID=686309 RepID=UPI003D92A23E